MRANIKAALSSSPTVSRSSGRLVGLKDVRVLAYTRHGPEVELVIEQILDRVRCPACGERARGKERPVAPYVDRPVYGTPMSLG